ncbi:serine/threonine-protein kinase [Dermatophilaceae bacterium Sec6.4]
MDDQPTLRGYELLQLLGVGGAGQVWAVARADGVRFAAKFVTGSAADTDGTETALRHEAAVLQSLHHEHVIRLYEVVPTDGDAIALIMQLAEGGSLADSLRTRDHLTPGELVTVLCPIARAMHDLHSMGLVHGDLSPGNVLFTHRGKPLIADLGFSRLAGHDDEPTWVTEHWAAPEVLAGEQPTPASDVYSLGAIAWAALVGQAPECAALRPDLASSAPSIPDALHDLVLSCMSHTPTARPTPEEFALALWQMAPPDPAPIQGSTGRRVTDSDRSDDPGAALTRRIREEAHREVVGRHSARPAKSAAGWRRPVLLRTVAAAAFVGLVAGGLMLVGNDVSAGANGDTASAVSAPSSASPAAKIGGRPSTALTTSSPGPSLPGPSAPSSRPGAAPRTAAQGQQQLQRSPTAVLQGLVDARAHAWSTGRVADLSRCLIPGSTAYQGDQADLLTARDRGVRYRNLLFRVSAARLRPPVGTGAAIEATVVRSGYHVVRSDRSDTVVPAHEVRTLVTVAWTPAGWRIASWAAL